MGSAFDLAWDLPGAQQNGHSQQQHFFGVSALKPLPLSLFGEEEEEDDREKITVQQPLGNGNAEEEEETAATDVDDDDDDDEFGEFESVSVSQNGNAAVEEAAGENSFRAFQSQNVIENSSSDDWGFSSTTSELMLAMHGIRSGRQLQKAEEFSFSRFTNGSVSSSPEFQTNQLVPDDNAADNAVDDSDNWGDFAEPSVSSVEAPNFTSLFLPEHSSAAGARSGLQADMIDLISMADEQPVEESSFTGGADGRNTGGDLLWDSGLDFQHADANSLIDSLQTIPVISDGPALIDLEVQKFENGFADDNWGFDKRLDSGSNYSRSVSLPDGNACSAESVPEHRRSHSNGDFSNFAGMEEWSFQDSTISGIVKQDEKDISASLENSPATTGNDLIDLLALDWKFDESAITVAEEVVSKQQEVDEANLEVDYLKDMEPFEMQLWYIKAWKLLSRVCACELQHGAGIWQQATTDECCEELMSTEQGQNHFNALLEIYKVHLILAATLQLYASWLEAATADEFTELRRSMDESTEAWSGFVEVLSSTRSSPMVERLQILDETLNKLWSSGKAVDVSVRPPVRSNCALTLLPLESVPVMSSTVWSENSYFLSVANLWANCVSHKPPFKHSAFVNVHSF